jgi:hypothetical protein
MGGDRYIGAPHGMTSSADYREACDYRKVGDYENVNPEKRIERKKQEEKERQTIKEERDIYYASLQLENISCHTFVPIKYVLEKSGFYKDIFLKPYNKLHTLLKTTKINNRFQVSKEVVDKIDFNVIEELNKKYKSINKCGGLYDGLVYNLY